MKRKFDKYKDFPKSLTTPRILGYLIDSILIVVASIVLTITVGGAILNNNDYYKNENLSLNNIAHEIYNLESETKLVIKDEKSETPALLSVDCIMEEYLRKQIALSYLKDPAPYTEAKITLDSTYIPATYENDNLAYYFAIYKAEKGIQTDVFGNKTPKSYFIEEILKKTTGHDLYVYEGENLPYLKSDVGISVYKYLNDKNSADMTHYETLKTTYNEVASKGLQEINNYEPFLNLYNQYIKHFDNVMNIHNLAQIVAYTISFILVILIAEIVFGYGLTLGRFLTKTRVNYKDRKIYRTIIRLLVEFIVFMPVIFVSNIFTFGFVSFTANIGVLQVILLLLIPVIALLVDIGFLAFTPTKRTLSDIFSGSYLVRINQFIIKNEELESNLEIAIREENSK